MKNVYTDPDNINQPIFVTVQLPNSIQVPDLNGVVNKHITIVCHVSCHLSNPQGQPDAENNPPRQDPFDGCGYVTVAGQNRTWSCLFKKAASA